MGEALKGRVAIVTGAGRGIGAATAALFASEGAAVGLVSRTATELESVADGIRQAGGRCLALPADVSDEQAVQAAFRLTCESLGSPDVLVNAAGVIDPCPFEQIEAAAWDHVMAVNLRGPFLCCREFFRLRIAAGKGGAIVNISSLGGVRGPEKFPGLGSYVVSKYGVTGLTDMLAVEGKPYGIRANCVSPGAVDTDMLRKAAPFLKTHTTPMDVARTILFLADEAQSARLTGANVEIFSNA